MITQKIISKDGTIKFIYRLDKNSIVESVIIPQKRPNNDEEKFCLCLSSQVGCSLGCKFCVTGKKGFKRNLSTEEIIVQLQTMWNHIQPNLPNSIVFMGMGEPFLNYENVISAIKIINDRKKFNFAEHKITVSTAGIVDKILDFGNDCNAKLAISLNAVSDQKRKQLMPINSKHEINEILEKCKQFPTSRRRLIMFEYIMFDRINDSEKDAIELADLIKDIPSIINLIPYNENQVSEFKTTPMERIIKFKELLISKGIKTFIRESKGNDISAACGMLRGAK